MIIIVVIVHFLEGRKIICVTLVVNCYSYHNLSLIPAKSLSLSRDLSTVSDSFLSREGKIF